MAVQLHTASNYTCQQNGDTLAHHQQFLILKVKWSNKSCRCVNRQYGLLNVVRQPNLKFYEHNSAGLKCHDYVTALKVQKKACYNSKHYTNDVPNQTKRKGSVNCEYKDPRQAHKYSSMMATWLRCETTSKQFTATILGNQAPPYYQCW